MMDSWVAVIIVCVAVFAACFLFDKGFTKFFRGKAQHATGLSVRLNKRYGAFGAILFALGLGALFAGLPDVKILLICGPIVSLMGVALIVYYMSFGIYYDRDSFIYSAFGKKSVTYRYNQIQGQMLYLINGGNVIELHMTDGKAVTLQSSMVGAYPFLDTAFEGWCRQRCVDPSTCDFHDTANSCWFPNVEGK
jgi:hypothetical protein